MNFLENLYDIYKYLYLWPTIKKQRLVEQSCEKFV